MSFAIILATDISPQCYESCKWLCSDNRCTISSHFLRAECLRCWWGVQKYYIVFSVIGNTALFLSMPCYVKHGVKLILVLRSAIFADPWLFSLNVSGNICIRKGQENVKQSRNQRYLLIADGGATQAATIQTLAEHSTSNPSLYCKQPSYM